ncbi:carbon-nitrogen hydrolase family protein [Mesorhizobium sp. M1D.F.Ca.ET.043.01.1.1]|uniref:carbon-nitrogen hydrolase family protein n=1 Tax=Mesorhizobium sp. M1D.F.Ca.ET.043.01.1.1 TaxID=2493669 RepID=UPI000F756DB4|nr:carbon-nitrogen hydrolase family protein [Mesorhizobium sp. M1D.F.Ca.ET.043.01.1.1]AZO75625.1 carbon-nitrogen hydrolase family protein [Mesorhizobium sp. M1D.F.Ca.ET.043.01.1.1]
MTKARKVIGAVAQVRQEFMNTPANLAKAVRAIEDAAKDGAEIIAFSECYLGQFPYWALYYDVSAINFTKVITALYEGAVSVGGEECRVLAEAARRNRIHVVMGCNELSDEPGSSTIYNTQLFFSKQGELIGRHRKLMPTYAERLVHGRGDGRDLRVHQTDIGNVGSLICWEHHMTLAKYTMATLGEEIHVACWPGLWRVGSAAKGERPIEADLTPPFSCDAEVAIREYAIETSNFVLSASAYLPPENISDEWRETIGPTLNADYAIGGSAIVAPGGGYIIPPVINEERLLVAELDFAVRRLAKAQFDPLGHYSRPDVFSLQLHDPLGRELRYSAPQSASAAPSPATPERNQRIVDESEKKHTVIDEVLVERG